MPNLVKECPADDALAAEFINKATEGLRANNEAHGLLVTRLSQYIGMLRAMHLWFHGAHNTVRGAASAGDHVELFGKIYLAIQEEIDDAIEKAIGVTGDEGLACPMHITKTALQVMSHYPSPPAVTSLAMASIGLEMEKHYLEMVEQMFSELESAGVLSLGLNDFLAASANAHEMHLYHLQQRVKTELAD